MAKATTNNKQHQLYEKVDLMLAAERRLKAMKQKYESTIFKHKVGLSELKSTLQELEEKKLLLEMIYKEREDELKSMRSLELTILKKEKTRPEKHLANSPWRYKF